MMDKTKLKELAARLTELASEIDDVAHDDKISVLFVSRVDLEDDGIDAVWEVATDYGALHVAGYDSVRVLARWLNAKSRRRGK